MNLWTIRNGFGITILLILLAVFPSTLRGIQPADDLQQAVVSIWPSGRCDERAGTGFFVSDKGHILTAAHVVRTFEVGQQVTVQWAPLGQQPQRFTAIVSHKKPEWDIALLKIQGEGKFSWLPLGDSNPERLRLGAEVTVAGFPQPERLGCTTITITTGQLTARKPPGEVRPLDIINVEALQLSIAPVRPGSSGSPVLDATGKVVGILFAGSGIPGPDRDLPFYFAVPINVAAETDALKLHEVLPSYPPEITFIKFPNKIIGDGQPYKGRVGFRDLNRDLIKARFQVKGSGVEIRDAEKTGPREFVLIPPRQVREETRGEFKFSLSVAVPNQEVTVNVTLEDEQRNLSEIVSFSFLAADYLLLADFTECRKKEPVSNWGAFSIKGWAKESCKDGVMRIVYNVSENDFPSARPDELVAGFWMQWGVQDFKPNDWDAISFSIWGDSKEGFTVKVKVEVKIREARWGWRQYCLEGITDKEQRVTIPLEKFVIADEWTEKNQFVLAFANQDPTMDCPVTVKKGAIYFDQITFRKKN